MYLISTIVLLKNLLVQNIYSNYKLDNRRKSFNEKKKKTGVLLLISKIFLAKPSKRLGRVIRKGIIGRKFLSQDEREKVCNNTSFLYDSSHWSTE